MGGPSSPVELVRKLLALADPARNPDQGEVENAFRRACGILRTEGLSLAQFVGGGVQVVERITTREVKVAVPCLWCQRLERRAADVADELLRIDVSDWERRFLTSIRARVREGRPLTERQVETLKRIAEDYGC
jgi:hypothetical protein